MFGGEPVVDRDDPAGGPAAEVGGEPDGAGGVAEHVGAAVEVQDDILGRLGTGQFDVDHRDAAEDARRGVHVIGQRVRGEQLVEHDPLLVHVAAEVERRVAH
jgi:hypothetical protein